MKKFTLTELGALILVILFLATGSISLIWPENSVILHSTNEKSGKTHLMAEEVTKDGSRVYGAISILLGIGLGALVLHRPKE